MDPTFDPIVPDPNQIPPMVLGGGSLVFLIMAATVVLMGFLFYFMWKQGKKREAALNALASSQGWAYNSQGDRGWDQVWPFNPYQTGRRRHCHSMFTGFTTGPKGSIPVAIYDYTYYVEETTTSANGGTTSRDRAVNVKTLAVKMPFEVDQVILGREGTITRMFDSIVGHDIDFEDEEFNRHFRVTSPNRKTASDILNPRMIEALKVLDPRGLAFCQGWLVWFENGTWDPGEILPTVAQVIPLLGYLPEFLQTPPPQGESS